MAGPVAYRGRKWILALRETRLWPALAWGLRRSTRHRAMIPPFLGALLNTVVCYQLLQAGVRGFVPSWVALVLVLAVFWPLALCCALCMDLISKEYRWLRTRPQ